MEARASSFEAYDSDGSSSTMFCSPFPNDNKSGTLGRREMGNAGERVREGAEAHIFKNGVSVVQYRYLPTELCVYSTDDSP